MAVLDGRAEVVSEITQSPAALRNHLVERFQALIENISFRQALSGHMPGDQASQARIPVILARIREICAIKVRVP